MNIVESKLIKYVLRKDQKGHLVHIVFYVDEIDEEHLYILLATRIVYNGEIRFIPYEFAKWSPEHCEFDTIKDDFENWKSMLEFTDSLVHSNPKIAKILFYEKVVESVDSEYGFLYENENLGE